MDQGLATAAPAEDPGAKRRPAGRRALGLLVRWRFAVLTAWTLACGYLVFRPQTLSTDWWVFEYGSRMLSGLKTSHYTPIEGGPLHLYTWFPRLQIGPPPLLAAVPTQLLPPQQGKIVAAVVMCGLGVWALWLIERIAGLVGVAADRVSRMTLWGGLLVLPAWAVLATYWMHLDDAIALTFTLWATGFVLRGRWWAAALLLGIAAAGKPWAVAFWFLLLLLPRARRSHAALLAMASAAVWWVPFVVADPTTFRATGNVVYITTADSTARLLGFARTDGGLRAFQLLTMIFVGWLVVRYGRWPAIVLAVVATRMLTDPQTWSYYTVGLVLGAFLVDVVATRWRWPWLTTLTAAFLLVQSVADVKALSPVTALTQGLCLLRLALLLPIIVLFAWPSRSQPFGQPLPAAAAEPEGADPDVPDGATSGEPAVVESAAGTELTDSLA